jgi:hypothetical protein
MGFDASLSPHFHIQNRLTDEPKYLPMLLEEDWQRYFLRFGVSVLNAVFTVTENHLKSNLMLCSLNGKRDPPRE